MAVTASQLPRFDGQTTLSLADLQALADCVRAAMQTTEAPPGLRRLGSAKAVRAHSLPAGQVIYFSGVEVQTPSYFLPRPGLVQDIGWQAGLTQPCIVRGHALLPLAQTHDDGGNAMTSGIAGGISAAIFDPAITSPRITAGGVLRLPPAGEGGTVSAPLAYFGSGITQPVPGLVGSVSFDAEAEAHANNGNVFLPLAYFTGGEATRPGGIRAIYQAEDSAIDKPLILNGDIYLPPPSGSGVECPLAYFGSGQLSQQAGKIAGFIFNLGIESPECSAGVIQFPAADFNGPGATRFGAIGAISVDSSIDSPEIRNGEILLPAYGSSTSIAGLRDYNGYPYPFEELGGGGAQRTLLARQMLSTSDGKGVGVELYAAYDRGFLQFALESWNP